MLQLNVKLVSNFANKSVFFNNFNKMLLRNLSTISKRLNGKVAIVTASTNGIGFAIARRLALEGSNVIVSSRRQENVDSAVSKLSAEGLDVTGLVCHVSNAEDRKKVFDTAASFGGLDILVSNAAVNPSQGEPFFETSEESWDKIFDVNVKAPFLLAKEGLPFMRKRNGGRVIFISSIAGFNSLQITGAYSVSKTALFGLNKAISEEVANENITVNCVAPGLVETNFSEFILENPRLYDVALKNIPMQRMGDPDEVSGVVSFLASDDASYISGETIVAAGGLSCRI